jgi:dihydrofolate reductase
VVKQYLNAGLVEEIILHVAPIILGEGVRLFENINKKNLSFKIKDAINSQTVTHLFYNIIKNNNE